MGGKIKIQPASRVGLDALVGMAEHLLAVVPGWEDTARPDGPGRHLSGLASDIKHLSSHDLDGILTASIHDDVVGMAVTYVRSRTLYVPHLLMLPEVTEEPVTQSLLRRIFAFGERAGVNDVVAMAVAGAEAQQLFFRFGMRPRFPVYRISLSAADATRVGEALSSTLPGIDLTEDALQRRAWTGEPERLDRVVRGVTRPMDHEYWLTRRRLRLATVREGRRITAYGYGGDGQCGPVTGSTPESALAAVGWALRLAAPGVPTVSVLVPAIFESAVEVLLEAGGAIVAAPQLMTRQPTASLQRCLLGSLTLF